jgi:MoaA/NifB/PqqE/SkfB family radical SAM enzyme
MIVFKKSETDKINLDDMLAFLSKTVSKHRGTTVSITAQPGRKYIKLVEETYGQRSVYCFIDYDGNIYKAASWAAPAKHVRGSVFDQDYGWGKALSPYGAAYLR